MRAIALLSCTLLLASCSADPSPSGQAEPGNNSIVYGGARLILGNGDVIENGALWVDGETIAAVGPLAAMTMPADIEYVDATGKTIIPAMIDAHVHVGYEGHTSWAGENYTAENVIDHLYRFAYYGFGAVFSTGTDPDELALQLQQRQSSGNLGGADLLFAAGMAPPGQGPNAQMLASASELSRTIVRGVSTPEEGRAAVEEIASMPIRFIKIWVDDRNGSQEKLQPDVYRAIIQSANEHGIAVVAHQQDVDDMKSLIDAGVVGFLHGRLSADIDDDVVTRLSENDVFLVPNIGLGERGWTRDFEDPFLTSALSETVVARLADDFQARPPLSPDREAELRNAFQMMLDGDVDILLGTDAGAVPDHFFGFSAHRELGRFVSLGMTPMDAIRSATSLPARHLGLESQGELAVGKRADFVVLDANPLDDIRNTRTISEVYLRGERVDREGLATTFRAGELGGP